MDVSEIAWGVGICLPPFKATAGWVMLQFQPPNFDAAKILFTITPLAPLIAMALWAYEEHPTIAACLIVAMVVGFPTVALSLELLRWVSEHEKRQ